MSVENNEKTTAEKLLGGVTGKGFMPGQSGNPGGRPKKTVLSDAYRAVLESGAAQIPAPEGSTLETRFTAAAAPGLPGDATLQSAEHGRASLSVTERQLSRRRSD